MTQVKNNTAIHFPVNRARAALSVFVAVSLLLFGEFASAQSRLIHFSATSGAAASNGDGVSLTTSLSQPLFGAAEGNGIFVQSGISLYARAHNILANVGIVNTQAPLQFALSQNYPNPFNPSTTIAFTLQTSGLTLLKIYDMIGREVATLVNEHLEAGIFHQKVFHANTLASGIYFARLTNGTNVQIKKMMLLR